MCENTQTQQPQVLPAPVTQRDGSSSLRRFNNALTNPDMQSYLTTVLGSRKEQFVNNLLAVVGNDTKLQGCKPTTLIYAAIKATALELPLDQNLGFAYIIPYNNKKKVKEVQYIENPQGGEPIKKTVDVTVTEKEAQFQIGYRGFIQLAQRSGLFSHINADKVYDGELLGVDKRSGEPNLNGTKKSDVVIGYFAYFRLLNGFEKTLYMTVDELRTHATRYSQTFSSGVEYIRSASRWSTDFEAMAKKTVIKLLLSKYAPLSVDIQGVRNISEALRADQGVMDENGNPEYVDAPDETTVNENAVAALKQQMRQNENTAPNLL